MKRIATLLLGGLVGFGMGVVAAPHLPAAEGQAGGQQAAATRAAAPDFTLPGWEPGTEVRLAAHHGKIVILNFFETSCPHCQRELPDLAKLQRAMREQGVQVIGVALDVSADEAGSAALSEVVREYGVSFPLAIGNEEVAQRYGGVPGVPTSFLIDRDGRIAAVFDGATGYQTLLTAIRRLD